MGPLRKSRTSHPVVDGKQFNLRTFKWKIFLYQSTFDAISYLFLRITLIPSNILYFFCHWWLKKVESKILKPGGFFAAKDWTFKSMSQEVRFWSRNRGDHKTFLTECNSMPWNCHEIGLEICNSSDWCISQRVFLFANSIASFLKLAFFAKMCLFWWGTAHNGVNHFSLLMPRMWFVTFFCVSVSPLCCLLQHFAWLLSMSTLYLTHSVLKEILIIFLHVLVNTFWLKIFNSSAKLL